LSKPKKVNVESIKIILYAQVMSRCVDFYSDVFGFRLQFSSEWWSELTFGDTIIALHGGGDGLERHFQVSFSVKDINETCRIIVENGGRVYSKIQDRVEEGIFLAKFADTEGNVLMLSQRK
jgi:predicted enzyme related to lactoylglutathione lyase